MLKRRLLAASAASYTVRGAFSPSRRLNTCNYNSYARIVNCHREFRIRCIALHMRFCSFPHVGHVNRMLVRRACILLARITSANAVRSQICESGSCTKEMRDLHATNKKSRNGNYSHWRILKFKLYTVHSLNYASSINISHDEK